MSHAVADSPHWTDGRVVHPLFRGNARTDRDRFLADALVAGPIMKAIVATAQAGYRGRSTNVSERLVAAIADRWRKVSLSGSLRQSIDLDGRELLINDLRVTASVARQTTWAEDAQEIGVCVIANSLTMKKKGMYWEAPLVAGASLHCLARWHQRALVTTPEALLADLRLLADQAPAILASGDRQFQVATNGGAWRGHRTMAPDGHIFIDARTFTWI